MGSMNLSKIGKKSVSAALVAVVAVPAGALTATPAFASEPTNGSHTADELSSLVDDAQRDVDQYGDVVGGAEQDVAAAEAERAAKEAEERAAAQAVLDAEQALKDAEQGLVDAANEAGIADAEAELEEAEGSLDEAEDAVAGLDDDIASQESAVEDAELARDGGIADRDAAAARAAAAQSAADAFDLEDLERLESAAQAFLDSQQGEHSSRAAEFAAAQEKVSGIVAELVAFLEGAGPISDEALEDARELVDRLTNEYSLLLSTMSDLAIERNMAKGVMDNAKTALDDAESLVLLTDEEVRRLQQVFDAAELLFESKTIELEAASDAADTAQEARVAAAESLDSALESLNSAVDDENAATRAVYDAQSDIDDLIVELIAMRDVLEDSHYKFETGYDVIGFFMDNPYSSQASSILTSEDFSDTSVIRYDDPNSSLSFENVLAGLEMIRQINIIRAEVGVGSIVNSMNLIAIAAAENEKISSQGADLSGGQYSNIIRITAPAVGDGPADRVAEWMSQRSVWESYVQERPELANLSDSQLADQEPSIWAEVKEYKTIINRNNNVAGLSYSSGGNSAYGGTYVFVFADMMTISPVVNRTGDALTGDFLTMNDEATQLIEEYRDSHIMSSGDEELILKYEEYNAKKAELKAAQQLLADKQDALDAAIAVKREAQEVYDAANEADEAASDENLAAQETLRLAQDAHSAAENAYDEAKQTRDDYLDVVNEVIWAYADRGVEYQEAADAYNELSDQYAQAVEDAEEAEGLKEAAEAAHALMLEKRAQADEIMDRFNEATDAQIEAERLLSQAADTLEEAEDALREASDKADEAREAHLDAERAAETLEEVNGVLAAAEDNLLKKKAVLSQTVADRLAALEEVEEAEEAVEGARRLVEELKAAAAAAVPGAQAALDEANESLVRARAVLAQAVKDYEESGKKLSDAEEALDSALSVFAVKEAYLKYLLSLEPASGQHNLSPTHVSPASTDVVNLEKTGGDSAAALMAVGASTILLGSGLLLVSRRRAEARA